MQIGIMVPQTSVAGAKNEIILFNNMLLILANELTYGEYVYVPQPNGSFVTTVSLLISSLIRLFHAHC
jgi:hypothetical protein